MDTTPPTGNQPRYDDEISLVDLALILIRRWKLIAAVFIVIVAGAVTYALSKASVYEYVSLYHVAEQAPSNGNAPTALEPVGNSVVLIGKLHLGPVVRDALERHELERLPFEIEVSAPENTVLIQLGSQTSAENAELVEELHQQLLERFQFAQTEQLERYQENLKRQLEDARNTLNMLESSSSPWAGEQVTSHAMRVANLEAQLTQFQPGNIVQVAVEQENQGSGRALILALGLVLGAMLAIMAAFFAEFGSAVRRRLGETNDSPSP